MKNNSKYKYYLPGILMIAVSLLIIAVPEVLAVLVASLLCMFGIAALSLGHMLRKEKVKIIRMERWNSDSDFFEDNFERIPVFRHYRKW